VRPEDTVEANLQVLVTLIMTAVLSNQVNPATKSQFPSALAKSQEFLSKTSFVWTATIQAQLWQQMVTFPQAA